MRPCQWIDVDSDKLFVRLYSPAISGDVVIAAMPSASPEMRVHFKSDMMSAPLENRYGVFAA